MAGHIDHGKTSLTKALTGVNTDKLKEEKERNISIEPGYAPFIQQDDLEVSIVDVPGHKRFIRQMIAGSVGIDFIMLVIAGDEGVMPQTKEHLNILSLLGIENGIIVITKIAQTDEELLNIVSEDVKEEMSESFLSHVPLFYVDSLSGEGIDTLKQYLHETISSLPMKSRTGSFRLPIDHVFTIKGQGVIVRGTIFNGTVTEGDQLTLLPAGEKVRVRQIQTHNERRKTAYAGQRIAINVGGIAHQQISRGDVLVADESFTISNRIDIVFYPLTEIKYRVKQRLNVKVYVGTSEVNGKIIFVDRNDLLEKKTDYVLCQLQLDDHVVMMRGDRFIIRRATPVETIGGGWIIDPNASKHKFGFETINELAKKKAGTATDRIILSFQEKSVQSTDELIKDAGISEKDLIEAGDLLIEIIPGVYTMKKVYEQLTKDITEMVMLYHSTFPLRRGINKAEVVSQLKDSYEEILIEFTFNKLVENTAIIIEEQFIYLADFERTYPSGWKMKLTEIEQAIIKQAENPDKWNNLIENSDIPSDILNDFYYFLIETGEMYRFDDDRLISRQIVHQMKEQLINETNKERFTLQQAREILQLSRKNLIPLLELFDILGVTSRDGNKRNWC